MEMKNYRRRPTISHDELSVLAEEVSRNKNVLLGKFSDSVNSEKKKNYGGL